MSDIFKNSPTFRLFKKRPSFLDGVASLVNLAPNADRYRQSKTPQEADVDSLQSDWLAIGADLHNAIDAYATKQ
jgi:hypothetical protein